MDFLQLSQIRRIICSPERFGKASHMLLCFTARRAAHLKVMSSMPQAPPSGNLVKRSSLDRVIYREPRGMYMFIYYVYSMPKVCGHISFNFDY